MVFGSCKEVKVLVKSEGNKVEMSRSSPGLGLESRHRPEDSKKGLLSR